MDRIKQLVELLNIASKAYYLDNQEIMPNIEYDKLYNENENEDEIKEIKNRKANKLGINIITEPEFSELFERGQI